MQYTNLHTHTVFSDGTCTPEEMAQAAIEKNMLSLGFSDHSPMDHDLTYCVKHQALPAYCREIRRLKEKYKDQIEIALGLEMDSLTSSCVCRADYDYVIGDCHYVHTSDGPMSIDHCIEGQLHVLREYFSMDGAAYSKSYFRTYVHDMKKMKPDILGHFDLTVKFGLIREDDPALSTVLSSRPGLAVIDAGVKSCGVDQGMPAIVGVECGEISACEEHFQLMNPSRQLKVGEKVRLIPGHCCSTMNLHEKIYVVDEGRVVGRLRITARGASR